MAHAYIRRRLPPPIITTRRKADYIRVLEMVDSGNLRAFSNYLEDLGQRELRACTDVGRQALSGHLERPNGNGGRTHGDNYLPPRKSVVQVSRGRKRSGGGRGC